jgi:hypothetical protein
LSSSNHGTFEEVAIVVYALCGVFEFETEPKGLIYYHVYANVANRIV